MQDIDGYHLGGEKEQLMTTPGEHKIYLRNRKGFIKLALTHGAHLVPMVRTQLTLLHLMYPMRSWSRFVIIPELDIFVLIYIFFEI